MGNQRVFDTGIVNKTMSGKGIGPLQGVASNSQFMIRPNGQLSVIATTIHDTSDLRKSSDNGFTWSNSDNFEQWKHQTYAPTYGIVHGFPLSLWRLNDWGNHTDSYLMAYVYNRELRWIGSWEGAEETTIWGEQASKYAGDTLDDYADGDFMATTGDGETLVYCTYTLPNQCLVMVGIDFNNNEELNPLNALQDWNVSTKLIVSGVIATKSKDELIHVACVGSFVPPDTLYYIPYTKVQGDHLNDTGTWGSEVTVHTGLLSAPGCSFRDLAIDEDGEGNIGMTYTVCNPTNTCSGYYAISNDAGGTWTKIYNPPPAGYAAYVDPPTSLATGSNDILAGVSGFLVSQLFSKGGVGNGDLFVKVVPSYPTDTDYSTDEWRKVNTVNGKVSAGKFFQYMNESIPNFGDFTGIRMAYQVGELNHKDGQDTKYSSIYHERLSNNAFPAVYSGVSYSNANIDYYASGYIDANTSGYIEKITQLGMPYSFTRYRPLEVAEVNGVSAYGSPETFEFEATVDPGAYGFPAVARSDDEFSDYIERDTRKIFYPANVYLDREFVLNKGGVLKRTIWLIRIMGNDYEVAQIVPRWLSGSIVYYEANLYVVGPSNDPFSKVILPSES